MKWLLPLVLCSSAFLHSSGSYSSSVALGGKAGPTIVGGVFSPPSVVFASSLTFESDSLSSYELLSLDDYVDISAFPKTSLRIFIPSFSPSSLVSPSFFSSIDVSSFESFLFSYSLVSLTSASFFVSLFAVSSFSSPNRIESYWFIKSFILSSNFWMFLSSYSILDFSSWVYYFDSPVY